MKRSHVLAILFFGGLWGVSEAGLGDALYAGSVPHASVYLTVIGFFILTVSRAFVPRTGAATLIAAGAMLFKFLNVPFFACHLAGIALLGVGWDVAFGVAKIRRPVIASTLAVYLGHVLFMAAMVFVFRSDRWIAQGFGGWLEHVGVSGTLTAVGCAIAVPLGLRLGERLRRGTGLPAALVARHAWVAPLVVTLGLWTYAIGAKIR